MPIVHLDIYIFTNNVPVELLSSKMKIGSVAIVILFVASMLTIFLDIVLVGCYLYQLIISLYQVFTW